MNRQFPVSRFRLEDPECLEVRRPVLVLQLDLGRLALLVLSDPELLVALVCLVLLEVLEHPEFLFLLDHLAGRNSLEFLFLVCLVFLVRLALRPKAPVFQLDLGCLEFLFLLDHLAGRNSLEFLFLVRLVFLVHLALHRKDLVFQPILGRLELLLFLGRLEVRSNLEPPICLERLVCLEVLLLDLVFQSVLGCLGVLFPQYLECLECLVHRQPHPNLHSLGRLVCRRRL